MRRLALTLAALSFLLPAFGQTTPAPLPASAPLLLADDPAPLLGLAVAETLERCGPPAAVFPVRGEEAWQDDVAFKYQAGYTLFLYGDRLWQLRFAAPYSGSVYGLFVGDDADKACSLLGEPYDRSEVSLVYRMPYRGYPVQLRLDLSDGKVSDIYLYRADF